MSAYTWATLIVSVLGAVPAAVFLTVFLVTARKSWSDPDLGLAAIILVGTSSAVLVAKARVVWIVYSTPPVLRQSIRADRTTTENVISLALLSITSLVMWAMAILLFRVRQKRNGQSDIA